jgi:hypothetical protein
MTSLERERTVEITREIAPYAPEDQLGTYELKRWTWYEKQMCLQRATTIIDAKRGMVETPMPDYNVHMLYICLVRGPFKRIDLKEDLKKLKALDPDVGDLLFEVLQELNSITQEEKAGFTEPPDSETPTPG